MGQFILDGIQFTADNTSLSTAGKKTSKFGNFSNAGFSQTIIDKAGIKPFVNAVEIDWNNAILPNYSATGLNTTGEILSVLNTAYNTAKNKYSKPSDGIPKTDLSQSVQTSLGNADSAIQSITVENHYKGSLGAKTSGLYKLTIDKAGHITAVDAVDSDDIIKLIGDYLNANYQKVKDVKISIPQSITRTKNTDSVSSITLNGGSFEPKEIKVGETSTIKDPTSIEVTYALTDTTATVTISGADSVNQTPSVISSDPSVIEVNGITLTAKKAGTSKITVVCNGVTNEQNVEVKNNSNKETKTSGWTYSASNTCVTIKDTTITGNSAGTPIIYVKYGKNNKTASLGTLTVKSAVNYYWYVGNKSPEGMNPPSIGNANSKLCQWTDLGSSLPTTSIKVSKSDTVNYDDHTWYIAAPTAAGFVIWNASNSIVDSGYSKVKTFMIGDVSYDLFKSKGVSDQSVVYLHK